MGLKINLCFSEVTLFFNAKVYFLELVYKGAKRNQRVDLMKRRFTLRGAFIFIF